MSDLQTTGNRNHPRSGRPKVVIIGGGFGGLTAAQALRHAKVDVTLIDRSNHHLFQPLLYQVASAGLSAGDIATPIRSILAKSTNTRVLLAQVDRVDVASREVVLDEGAVPYDFLIVAAGAGTTYFGHDDWEKFAPGLKAIDDALTIRHRVLLAFERAEREPSASVREALVTFVVIGGGATGVELAGALSELSRFALKSDFRNVKPEETRVILIESGPRLIPAFDETLSASAKTQLESLGVDVRLGTKVTRIDETGVDLEAGRIEATTVVWAAGVATSPLAKTLGVPLDKQGRVVVTSDLSIPGHPEVFVLGDMAHFEQDGKALPGLSPVAMQGARAVAKAIQATLDGSRRKPFHYWDKGSMATIGRSRAVAQVKSLHLTGFVAWLAWLFVHLWYLIGFRNRVLVLFEWFWSYVTYRRGARLITGKNAAREAAPVHEAEAETTSGVNPVAPPVEGHPPASRARRGR